MVKLTLHENWKVLASNSGAEEYELNLIKQHFSTIPQEYLDVARMATSIELENNEEKYLRIWRPFDCVKLNELYGISKWIKNVIPIGDDGGSKVLFYSQPKIDSSIYLVGFGSLFLDEAKFIASSLSELLIEGEGIDRL